MITAATIRVPDSLTELGQWLVWKYERRDGDKPTKVPHQINGNRASSTDPKTWCSFDDALKIWQQQPNHWSRIGFVFSATDTFFGLDLDQCLDAAGKLKLWAQPIMERFFDSYAEISPSGRGIKIWAKGTLPGAGVAFPLGDGRVEVYDQAWYFTVTGNHWAGQMFDVEEHQADLDWLLALSPHGQKKVPYTVEGKIPKGSQHERWSVWRGVIGSAVANLRRFSRCFVKRISGLRSPPQRVISEGSLRVFADTRPATSGASAVLNVTCGTQRLRRPP